MKHLTLIILSALAYSSALAQIPTLTWAARDNLDGDNLWADTQATGRTWTLAEPAISMFGPTDYPQAPVWFNSVSGSMGSLDGLGGSTQNASWELVFRPVDLVGNHVLFETGGNGDGTAFVMQGADLEFRVQDANDPTQRVIVTHTFAGGDEANFHHVVATVVVGATGVNEVNLYVNGGAPVATLGATAALNDWAGGDGAGLGRLNGGLPTGQTGFDAFTGDIALLNYYQGTVLTQAQVQAKTDELASGELDSEPDGLLDFWEMHFFNNLDELPGGDGDMDNLTNEDEFNNGTNPTLADTDGDGLDDDVELNAAPPTSPTRADTDGDGLDDGEEDTLGTDPTDTDSDDDGFGDGLEVDNNTDPNDPNDPPASGNSRIVWITENNDFSEEPSPDDVGWTNLLSINGFDVVRNDVRDLDVNQAALDEMNAADLVIISRDTNSGNYNNSAAEVEAWNGITAPVIQMSSFLVRNSRWFWFNNNANPVATGNDIQASEPAHPIFAGITLDGNNQFTIIEEEQVNVTGGTDAGNGTVLATDPGTGNVWIAYWDAGVEFYAGSGQTAGAPRLWFGAGVVDNNPKGGENFTADGEAAFLNAVRFMIGEERVLKFTQIDYDEGTEMITLTWDSTPSTDYALFYSEDLDLDIEENDNIPSQGESTTVMIPNPLPGASRLYFQVIEN